MKHQKLINTLKDRSAKRGLSHSTRRFGVFTPFTFKILPLNWMQLIVIHNETTIKTAGSKIMRGHLYFEIHADDLERAAGFYSSVFGWKFHQHESQKDLPVEYLRIETGGTAGGMLKRPSEKPPPECGSNAFVCSFEVDDFDQTAEIIQQWGGTIAMPKFAVPGVCWQGYFLDTEGNTFGLFQTDSEAR